MTPMHTQRSKFLYLTSYVWCETTLIRRNVRGAGPLFLRRRKYFLCPWYYVCPIFNKISHPLRNVSNKNILRWFRNFWKFLLSSNVRKLRSHGLSLLYNLNIHEQCNDKLSCELWQRYFAWLMLLRVSMKGPICSPSHEKVPENAEISLHKWKQLASILSLWGHFWFLITYLDYSNSPDHLIRLFQFNSLTG